MNPSRPTGKKHSSFPDPAPDPPARSALRISPRILFALSIGLASFVFAVYSRSLPFQFILDDHRFTSDPRVQEAGHVWEYFTNYVWGQFAGGPPSFYRPLFIVWMRANFLLSGLSPWGWHFLSILKHLSVALLLGLLAWKLLHDALAALTAATLFALHPAQTESVSWVTVPDPLMSLGILGSLLLYLRYMESSSLAMQGQLVNHRKRSTEKSAGQRSPLWLAASTAAYFAALLAKETAITFPCVIVALDLHMGRSLKDSKLPTKPGDANPRASIRTYMPRLAQTLRRMLPFVCVTVLYLLLRLNALSGKLGAVTQHLPWTTLLLSWPSILCFYVKALLWPVKSYSFADPILVEAFSARAFLLPLLALACAVVLLAAVVLWAGSKSEEPGKRDSNGIESALIVGTVLLVLPLLLTLNLNALNPGDFLHGRYTYLPLAGLMLLVATGCHLLGKLRVASLYSLCALAIVFALLTFAQENQWKDDSTVFTVAHQLAPHNAPVARNLADTRLQAALELDEQGRCPEAMPVFEQVTQEYPQNWYAWAGLGDCYVQLNNLPKAEVSLHRAADLSHNSRVIQQWQQLRAQMGLSTVP